MTSRLVAPVGPLLRPMWKAAQLIAGCTEWQKLTASPTATEAFARIHWPFADDRPDDDDATQPRNRRPRIMLAEGNRFTLSREARQAWKGSGSLEMTIELPVFEALTFWPANLWPETLWPANLWPAGAVSLPDRYFGVLERIGNLLREMAARSGGEPDADDVVDPLNCSLLNVVAMPQTFPTTIQNPADWDGAYFAAAMFSLEWL